MSKPSASEGSDAHFPAESLKSKKKKKKDFLCFSLKPRYKEINTVSNLNKKVIYIFLINASGVIYADFERLALCGIKTHYLFVALPCPYYTVEMVCAGRRLCGIRLSVRRLFP